MDAVIHSVTNTTELSQALDDSLGGDEISCAPGEYPFFGFLTRRYSSKVRVFSEVSHQAIFVGQTVLNGCRHVTLDGFHFRQDSMEDDRLAVMVDNIADTSENIGILNGLIEGGNHGMQIGDTSNLEVIGNSFKNIRSDNMKFWGLTNFQILNNTGAPIIFPRVVPDDHADFMQFQGTSSSGTIAGNVLLIDPSIKSGKVYQGIFLKDGNYSFITITNNFIYTNAANGVYVENGSNIDESFNTAIAIPGGTHAVCNIKFVNQLGPVTRANSVANSGGQLIPAPQWQNPGGTHHYNDLWLDAMLTHGGPSKVEDFEAVPGSPAETQGAFARINELLGTPPMAETFTYSLETPATNGTAVINTDGTGTYDPTEDYVGTDVFTYRKTSSLGAFGTGDMNVNVTAPPVSAPNGSFNVTANTQAVFDLSTL